MGVASFLSDFSLIDALAIVLEKSREEDAFKIVVEREEGATLNAIGEKYNLTRERIRQKIEKYLNRISPYMKALTSELLKDKGYFSIDQLLDIYDDDDYDRIVTHWCKNYELLEYISFARVFVLSKTDRLSEKDEIVEKILELVNEGCRCEDLIANLDFDVSDAGYAYMNMDAIYELLKENGFTIQGEYIFKEKESYSQICSWIVRDYFPKGIKLYNSQELNKLRDLVKIHVGNINLPEDDKSLSVRLSERLVLADRGYAIAKEHITIDATLLEDIKKYIDNVMTSKQVYYSEIFERFKDKLISSSNVNNHHFLHGVLLEYFPRDYDYARDYLVKKDGSYIFEDIATRINQYIVRHGAAIKKSQISKEFPGVSDAMLLGIVQSNEKLIQWEPNAINSLDVIKITSTDYKKLENLLALGTKSNGYCSENKLFTILKDIDCDFANKYGINKASHLFGLCDKLFENQYNFKRPHISSKNIEGIDSFKDIVNYLLGDSAILSYTEFNAISEENEWSSVSVGMVFTELENDYYRISKDLYVKKESFALTDSEIETIYQNVLKLMSKGILSLLGFNNWEGFPKLKYEWNEFLLATIVKNFIDGVKVIYPNYTDRRIEKGIVVLNEMDIDDYEDIIEYWMRCNNIISIPENELLKKMMQDKLTYKVIPKEVYAAKRIKLQNGIFTISEKQLL